MTIKLDRERKVRFNTAAIIQIEEQLDCSIFDILSKQMRVGTIAVVIWAGLEDDMELEDVKKILPLNRLIEVTQQIFKALTVAMGSDEETYDKAIADGGIKKKVESTKISENGSEKPKKIATVS